MELGITNEKIIIIYCQTPVRSAHMYFTLRLLGYHDIRVYEGSWAEWGNDSTTPIENPSLGRGISCLLEVIYLAGFTD